MDFVDKLNKRIERAQKSKQELKRILEQCPEGEAHWVLISGFSDAPPDDVFVARTQKQAISKATEWADLSKVEQDRLALLGHVYLNITAVGSDYIELYECRCNSPHWHYMPADRRVTA